MHKFLRSIGFGSMPTSEYEVEKLLEDVYSTCHQHIAVKREDGSAYVELSRSYGPNMGLRLCGIMDEYGFHRLCYYPYLNGTGVTTEGEVTVQSSTSGNTLTGVVDDGRVGISLIFQIQNPAEYQQESLMNRMKGGGATTTFSGLALSGKILLPRKERPVSVPTAVQDDQEKRAKLVSQAKEGNQEAIQDLAMKDMDTFAMITRRVQKEDILTIVDSYVMPFGMECDQYQVLGTILFYTKVTNSETKEQVYQFTIECNDMVFDVCVNERDLLGEPEVGRRFKGNIWLQGRMNF